MLGDPPHQSAATANGFGKQPDIGSNAGAKVAAMNTPFAEQCLQGEE
jgi:hypothetical protein